MKIVKLFTFLLFLLTAINKKNYPLYKQCDPTWGAKNLGHGTTTICK